MEPVVLLAIPTQLDWTNPPEHWQADGDGLVVVAGAGTDLFTDPGGAAPIDTSPRLTFPVDGPCLLTARVNVDFRATFDAGVLIVYQRPELWAKLCFERSVQGRPTVVTVATRGTSDDCNSDEIDGDTLWLRVAVLQGAFAFHASPDGRGWKLIRHFALDPGAPTRLGFSAQSPTGAGCTARFSSLSFARTLLTDIRSGR